MAVATQEMTMSSTYNIIFSQDGGEESKVLCRGVLHKQKKMLFCFQMSSSYED